MPLRCCWRWSGGGGGGAGGRRGGGGRGGGGGRRGGGAGRGRPPRGRRRRPPPAPPPPPPSLPLPCRLCRRSLILVSHRWHRLFFAEPALWRSVEVIRLGREQDSKLTQRLEQQAALLRRVAPLVERFSWNLRGLA